MKLIAFALSAFLLSGLSSHAQSSAVIYGNTENRFGFLTGWETRASSVTFNDLGVFDFSTGGLAVSNVNGYGVSFEDPSIYFSFALSNPSAIVSGSPVSAGYLDSLVYDPTKDVVYSHSDQGEIYTFASDGTETHHGALTGLGVGGDSINWGSHGDLAIAPDSHQMYQVGFDVENQTDESANWHSLLLIQTDSLTSATRIGQVSTEHGLVWGLAFDELGSLFGVTSLSRMIEIDTTDGSILWWAPIVDASDESVEMWDLASHPYPVPEPTGMLLMGCGVIACLLARRKWRSV